MDVFYYYYYDCDCDYFYDYYYDYYDDYYYYCYYYYYYYDYLYYSTRGFEASGPICSEAYRFLAGLCCTSLAESRASVA